jgi:hypothetical protein
MIYNIIKVGEADGVWFRAYDDMGNYVEHTVSKTAEGCEDHLREVVASVNVPAEFIKQVIL